jgi:hypothetical protein
MPVGKPELDEVVSNGETNLLPTTQCGTVQTETRSSLFSKVHRCIFFVKIVPAERFWNIAS